jgi:hypothetical protein
MCEQFFEGNSTVTHPNKPSNVLEIPIVTDKFIECEIKAKILIGNSSHSEEFLCLHKSIFLKKFAIFKGIPQNSSFDSIDSFVSFDIMDRPSRIAIWAEKSFNVDSSNGSYESTANSIKMSFLDVKNDQPLLLIASITSTGMNIKISTPNISVAGEIIQDIA